MSTRPRLFDLILHGTVLDTRSTLNRTYSHCVAIRRSEGLKIVSCAGSYQLAVARLAEITRNPRNTCVYEIHPLTLRPDNRPETTPAKATASRKATLTKRANGWLKSAEWYEKQHKATVDGRETRIAALIGSSFYNGATQRHEQRGPAGAAEFIDQQISSYQQQARECREKAARVQAERAALG